QKLIWILNQLLAQISEVSERDAKKATRNPGEIVMRERHGFNQRMTVALLIVTTLLAGMALRASTSWATNVGSPSPAKQIVSPSLATNVLPLSPPTSPPTFTVNSLADVVASAPLDNGICETNPGNGICTLRAAIMKANHFPGGGVTINIP